MYINDKNSRLAGIEPATPRLEVWCATNCATNAINILHNTKNNKGQRLR